MNNKPLIRFLIIATVISLTACVGETEQENTTETEAPAAFKSHFERKLEILAGSDNTTTTRASILYGKKATEYALDCQPAIGICEIESIGEGNSTIIYDQDENWLSIFVNATELRESDPTLYNALTQYPESGVIQFEDTFVFSRGVREGLGASVPIVVTPANPISVLRSTSSKKDSLVYVMGFEGILPGQQAFFDFFHGTEALHSDMNIALLSDSSINPGYTSTLVQNDSLIFLQVTMNVANLYRLGHDIQDIFPTEGIDSVTRGNFVLTRDFVFDDPDVAASVSVPQGWHIPSGVNFLCEPLSTGWFIIQFQVYAPAGDGGKGDEAGN